MPAPTLLLAALDSCAPLAEVPGFTRGERDPVVDLGTLADDEDVRASIDPELLDDGCAAQTVGINAVGPRIHDPQDPYTLMTITMQATIPGEAEEGTDARLCNVTCTLSSTDCWLSRNSTCEPIPDQPMPVSFGATTEAPGNLVLCIQATGASKLPLRELVELNFNDAALPRRFVVTGPTP